MAWTLLNSQSGNGAFDSRGADLIVVVMTDNAGGGLGISDSLGNTWTPRTLYSSTAGVKILYSQSPITGAAQTFTYTGSPSVPLMYVAAFSGSVSSPYDTENGTGSGGGATNQQSGAITASVNNELFITGLVMYGSGAIAVDSGFTVLQSSAGVGEVHYGGGIAWRTTNIADGAINPKWSWTTELANQQAATIASFKGASSSAYTTSITETANAADTISAIAAFLSSVTEAVSALDAIGSKASFIATVSESATSLDILSGSAKFLTAAIESANAADVVTASVSLLASVSETSAALDSLGDKVGFAVAISEPTNAIDGISSTAQYGVLIVDVATAIDIISTVYATSHSFPITSAVASDLVLRITKASSTNRFVSASGVSRIITV